MSTPKRIDWIKQRLLSRRDLTHQTLIDADGGWRLSALIYYLRHKARPRWSIDTVRDHNGIGHYRLPKGWTPEAPEKKEGQENGRRDH